MAETKGFLRQFLVDDKGCVVIAMWGLSNFNYKDNAARSLVCAFLISTKCNDINHRCSIGITTGNAYCGNVGSSFRCDYVAIGSCVNISARLMCEAKEKILIDEKTYELLPESVRHQLHFYNHVKLKGINQPAMTYVYASSVEPKLDLNNINDFGIFDRMRSKQEEELLTSLSGYTGGRPLFIVLHGDGAIGSRYTPGLADAFIKSAKASKRFRHCYRIRALTSFKLQRYSLIRELLKQMLVERNVVGEQSQRDFLRKACSDAMPPRSIHYNIDCRVERLRELLELRWFDVSEIISGYQKYAVSFVSTMPLAETLVEDDWLLAIVVKLFENKGVVIVIEDAHFCDELSMTLMSQLEDSSLTLAVLLTACPSELSGKEKRRDKATKFVMSAFGEKLAAGLSSWSTIRNHTLTHTISTPLLSEEENSSVVQGALINVDPVLPDLILDMTLGEPYWTVIVLAFIQDFGLMEFQRAYADARDIDDTSGSDADDMLFPFVTHRLQPLSYHSQTVLKWASVFGDEFSLEDLAAMLPKEFLPAMKDAIFVLVKHLFVVRSKENSQVYHFSNSVVRKAIYSTITHL